MEHEKLVSAAMSIIIHAGDARLNITQALNAISENQYEEVKDKLKQAQEKITAAHEIQTEIIQGEARGEEVGYSLLFAHAQDTLMTINSELILAKQLYKLFESFEKRVLKLEKGE
ncbi:PTS lactose/cellobiose transporter subunit IIA [Vallitalea maricola]|uniref:PTS lactose/cellobiose transporter subunit IIA n=1 Tax=Vallitalea maricola TaxID=3074433 RepID=A0ACB5UHS6_9FIRM|nr:PTS lactose/cellobiose transporter subunit IIA [Vallitalea sp. AN17-2]